MKAELRLLGLDAVLATLKSLPPEIVSKRGGPARAALRKGAVVIQKRAKENFRMAVALPGKSGVTQSTGFTEKQIVIRRKRLPAGENGEMYVVTVSAKLHPEGGALRRKSRADPNSKRKSRGGPAARPIQANDIAFMMEYGTSKQPATPWLRPAFAEKAPEAIATVERELVRGIDRIVRKLLANKKGR